MLRGNSPISIKPVMGGKPGNGLLHRMPDMLCSFSMNKLDLLRGITGQSRRLPTQVSPGTGPGLMEENMAMTFSLFSSSTKTRDMLQDSEAASCGPTTEGKLGQV